MVVERCVLVVLVMLLLFRGLGCCVTGSGRCGSCWDVGGVGRCGGACDGVCGACDGGCGGARDSGCGDGAGVEVALTGPRASFALMRLRARSGEMSYII